VRASALAANTGVPKNVPSLFAAVRSCSGAKRAGAATLPLRRWRRGDVRLQVPRLGDKTKRAMLFGHNPDLAELAHRLCGDITDMPTCAVAEFTFNTKSWSSVGKRALSNVSFCSPKQS
jgi:phosphohistidine phosphatase SixA